MNKPVLENYNLKIINDGYILLNKKYPNEKEFNVNRNLSTKRVKIKGTLALILTIILYIVTILLICINKPFDLKISDTIIISIIFIYPILKFIWFISSKISELVMIILFDFIFEKELYELKIFLNYESTYNNELKIKIADYEKQFNIYQLEKSKIQNEILQKQKEDEYRAYCLEQENLKKQSEFWLSLDGFTFEKEIAKLFEKYGYSTKVTKGSGDEGADIIIFKNNLKTIVQCKAHKKPVGPHIVRDLYGTLIAFKAQEAILVCTAGFTSGVHEYVKNKPIKLMEMRHIIEMANK